VTAYRDGDRVVVLIPARFSADEEADWVGRMVARLDARDRRARRTDEALLTRARALSARYLDGAARAAGVRWVANQRGRWGSATPADRTIRLSTRLVGMPDWVVDYVLLHELAHLVEPGHGREFWQLLDAYPRTERARGYLEGAAAAAGLDMPPDDVDTGAAGDVDPAP